MKRRRPPPSQTLHRPVRRSAPRPPPPPSPADYSPSGLAEAAPAPKTSTSTLGADARSKRQVGIPEADLAAEAQDEGASGYFADQLKATPQSALTNGDADALARDDRDAEEQPAARQSPATTKDAAKSESVQQAAAPRKTSTGVSAGPSAGAGAHASPSASQSPSAGAATPFDYNPSFYTAYPEVSTAYSAALAAQNSGRHADAVAAFAPFLAASRSDVAQDAAWRAARCLRSLGQPDDALATVQAGLRRSSANTPHRSNLYVILGELHSAAGRAGDAQKAWTEAARLNAER